MVAPVSADIVPRGSRSIASASAISSEYRPNDRSVFDIVLHLSGYRDVAVSSNLLTLINKSAGFKPSSAAGSSYLDGFGLLSPLQSQRALNDAGDSNHPGGNYGTAMFNVAAFDGQSVILNTTVTSRTAERRSGVVNLENLHTPVPSVSPAVSATSIPEPTPLTLLGAGLLGMLGASRWRLARNLLPVN